MQMEEVAPCCCLMSSGSRLFLLPLPNRTSQRPSVSPDGGSLPLRHVGFPCPLAHRHLPWAGCIVSRSPLASGVLSGSDALVSRSATLPAASMVSSTLTSGALALLLSILLCCCIPIMPQVCLAFLPRHLYLSLTASSWLRTLRGRQGCLPWSDSVISRVPKQLTPACKLHSYTPLSGMLWMQIFFTCLRSSRLAVRGSALECTVRPAVSAVWCLSTLVGSFWAIGRPSR